MKGSSVSVAYLGPAGTYAWEAAINFMPLAELFPCNTIRDVMSIILREEVDLGVVPMKNSLEGAVNLTVDLLIHNKGLPVILGEVDLPIHHSLLVKPGLKREDIQVLVSHPQALAQCRDFVERELDSSVIEVEAASTMKAVKDMMEADETKGAAIASSRAAALYGAEILAQNIEDVPTNTTRFIVLGRGGAEPTGNDKTSLCFRFENPGKPGILRNALSIFSDRGINLTRIESRPSRGRLDDDIFWVDADGHVRDISMKEALSELQQIVARLRVFGSYPKAEVLT